MSFSVTARPNEGVSGSASSCFPAAENAVRKPVARSKVTRQSPVRKESADAVSSRTIAFSAKWLPGTRTEAFCSTIWSYATCSPASRMPSASFSVYRTFSSNSPFRPDGTPSSAISTLFCGATVSFSTTPVRTVRPSCNRSHSMRYRSSGMKKCSLRTRRVSGETDASVVQMFWY